MEITICVNKNEVYEEVAQTTSYTGAKMGEEDYQRIFTTKEDQSQLNRFWDESCVDVCEVLKKFLSSEEATADGHTFVFAMSQSFDTSLTKVISKELFSFFVMNITAKWYVFTNKKEAPEYTVNAATLLEGVHRKACYKRKPQRPTY